MFPRGKPILSYPALSYHILTAESEPIGEECGDDANVVPPGVSNVGKIIRLPDTCSLVKRRLLPAPVSNKAVHTTLSFLSLQKACIQYEVTIYNIYIYFCSGCNSDVRLNCDFLPLKSRGVLFRLFMKNGWKCKRFFIPPSASTNSTDACLPKTDS